jgi:processive 1,2-diacylglycerol beta-glucosyltransferase
MKKIIIMTVGFGGGHKAMARNLTEVIHQADPSVKVKTIDAIHDAWPAFSDGTAKAYAGSTSRGNAFWFRLYYVITDRFPAPMRWFGQIMFKKYARALYAKERPDLMIATFPFLADVAVQARDYHHGTTPVIVTVTDASRVQGIWLSKRADMTLTATPDTVEYMVGRGLDEDKVRFVGFPAAKQFYKPLAKPVVRKRVGLKTDVFTILLTAGGAGLNQQKVLAVARAISKLRTPYQIILNAGNNDDLRKEFESMKFPYAEHVIVEGFTDKMPDYIAASDVICCKSGWLTINEALVLQRPLILYDAVPGHEEQNVDYVVKNNFGRFEPEPQDVVREIRRLMTHPKAFLEYQTSMKNAHTNRNPYHAIGTLIMSYLIKQR